MIPVSAARNIHTRNAPLQRRYVRLSSFSFLSAGLLNNLLANPSSILYLSLSDTQTQQNTYLNKKKTKQKKKQDKINDNTKKNEPKRHNLLMLYNT